jgi:hypothetical protein
MRTRHTVLVSLVVALLGVGVVGTAPTASGQGYHLVGAPEAYTLVNLHPDEGRKRLYSVNYQQPGLIPRCTRVVIKSVDSKAMKFRLADGGAEYEYIFHNSLRDSVPKHLDKYFGASCDKAKVQQMSKADQDGIAAGRVAEGMTRDGVILAIGYPPEHATPSLEANAWRYWKNRFGTMLVHFEGDKVVRIQN